VSVPARARAGDPCNGCGYCCITEPCGLAVQYLGATSGPCPALEWEAGRTWCGMVRHPMRHLKEGARHPEVYAAGNEEVGRLFARVLGGVGGACDTADDT
jgi:hypothetical protein